MITANYVRELFGYEPSTGALRWKRSLNSRGPVGALAGCIRNGYRIVSINGRRYGAHNLAWVHVHGVWPAHELDHANRKRADNRIANLREVTRMENMQNTVAHTNNTSGFKGVHYYPPTKRWVASIRVAGRKTNLGYFSTREAAAAAYSRAASTHHKYNPSGASA